MMASLRKGDQILTASRTGVPVVNDYEVIDQEETRKGAWAVVIAIALAFALILQMEAENSQTEAKRTVSSRMATVFDPS
jgi:hypothetical protein